MGTQVTCAPVVMNMTEIDWMLHLSRHWRAVGHLDMSLGAFWKTWEGRLASLALKLPEFRIKARGVGASRYTRAKSFSRLTAICSSKLQTHKGARVAERSIGKLP